MSDFKKSRYDRYKQPKESPAGTYTAEMPSDTSLLPSSPIFNEYTVNPLILQSVNPNSTTSPHSVAVEGSSKIKNSDNLSENHPTSTPLSTSDTPAHNRTALPLNTYTNQLNALPIQDRPNYQPIHPLDHIDHPQTLPELNLTDDYLSMDNSSTWSTDPNLLYLNSNPYSGATHLDVSHQTPTSHPSPTYPDTNQTQLTSYLYAASSDILPFSEWSIKKNNWEVERLEKL